MSRRSYKKDRKFQFLATILIAAIVTIWLGILGNYIWKQMAPVNQLPEQPTEAPSPQPDPSAPIAVTPLPETPPSQTVPSPAPTPPTFEIPDNPPVQTLPQTPTPTIESQQAQPRLNHLPYQEARGNLVKVGVYYDRSELMVEEAARAFWAMEDAAKQSGINLGPISGFRTVADQNKLFERQVSKHDGSEEAAARLSAPPGYSEHHTGYTIDIRDRDEDTTDLKYAMENTRAYDWLRNNACNYGFELSFPKKNEQGVSFEPWHWRYIDSPAAQQIFANAHQRYQAPTDCAVS